MKLLARAYFISSIKSDHCHYNTISCTISEWKWHMINMFDMESSLDCALFVYHDLIPYLLNNGATLCTRKRDGRIEYLYHVYEDARYDIFDVILSHPHFRDELRMKHYKFYYTYDDIDCLHVLLKHGHRFRSHDISSALLYKSYNVALYMCDHICNDDVFWMDNDINFIDYELYQMIKSPDENIQNIGCEISKKLFPKSGHH